MKPIDTKTIAMLEAVQQDYMLDTCGICTRTETTSGGVTKPTYGSPVSTKCSWMMDSGREFVNGELRTATEASATVVFPVGTVVTAKDMLTFDGRKWNVEYVEANDTLSPGLIVRVKELK